MSSRWFARIWALINSWRRPPIRTRTQEVVGPPADASEPGSTTGLAPPLFGADDDARWAAAREGAVVDETGEYVCAVTDLPQEVELVEPPPAMPPAPEPEVVEYDEAEDARPRRKHKPHDFSYYHLRKDLAGAVSYVLDRFERLRRLNHYFAAEIVRDLEELWGCDFLLWDKELGEKMKGGDKWSAITDAPASEVADVVWPVDYAFAMTYDDCIQLIRLVSVTPRDVRGRGLIRVVPRMLKVTIGSFGNNDVWNCATTYLGLVGESWIRLWSNDDLAVDYRRKLDHTIQRIMPSILTARYEWHVALGTIPGGPRVLLPTNPTDAVQLFKNRDVPVEGTRRDKLKHWVGEHWRDDGGDGLIYVRNHLRGHTAFDWAGFGCEIFPSAFDLEKNEEFRRQAADWRAQRKHNRVRVRLKRK